MRILFLSRWFPYPPDNGSRIRVYNLIKQLSQRHDITLISFVGSKPNEDQVAAMRRYCGAMYSVPHIPFQPQRLKALLGFLSSRPRSFVDTHSTEMVAMVQQISREETFDLALASQIETAPYATLIHSVPRVFEEVELTIIEEQFTSRGGLRRLRAGLTWWKLSHFARELLHQFDACTVASKQEQTRVLELISDFPVAIIPNGVDISFCDSHFGAAKPDTLIFSGALTYRANYDAMAFFLRQVFPLIRARRPEVKLYITGRTDGVPLERLPLGEKVVLTGYLEDVRPAVAQSQVCVVPLLTGGGTRLKILEAMALGTPVVSTTKGAEGLEATPGEDILIADEPTAFANAILRLLDDAALRTKLAANGQGLVLERYGWDQIAGKLDQLLHQVVQRYRHQGTE